MRAIVFDINGVLLNEQHELQTGVDELLVILKRLGHRLGAITDTDYRNIVQLEEAGIRHYFDAIVSPERVSAHFPNPESLHKAMVELDAFPHETIVVSTREHIITASKRAQVHRTIALTHGFTPSAQTGPTNADHLINGAPAFLDVLE